MQCLSIHCGEKICQINSIEWKIPRQVNCNSYNTIYMIHCKKENYQMNYIGQAGLMLKNTILEHRVT